jgi:cyclomaltodextrinase
MRLEASLPPRTALLLTLLLGWGCATEHTPSPEGQLNGAFLRVDPSRLDTYYVSDLVRGVESNLTGLAASEGVDAELVETALGTALIIRQAEQSWGQIELLGDAEIAIPVVREAKERITFSVAAPGASDVFLFGSFNGWSRTSLPMDTKDDGSFTRTLSLSPGSYQFKYLIDDQEQEAPPNVDRVSNGMGGYNRVLNVAPADERRHALHLVPGSHQTDTLRLTYAVSGDPVDTLEKGAVFVTSNLVPTTFEVVAADIRIPITSAMRQGTQRIRVAASYDGVPAPLADVLLLDGIPAGEDTTRNTWFDTILYSLMVDRFKDGDPSNNAPVADDRLDNRVNYVGGDLAGVLDQIRTGYFSNLGVNTLWISPVYRGPTVAFQEYPPPHRWFSGYHGYWPVSHTEVDPRFGDMALLREVVDAAHDRNMRVLLDFVANHVHEQHPIVTEHPDWFGELALPDGSLNIRRWDEYRLTTWFEPYLPSFDLVGSDEALEYLTDNALWWLEQTGADGFRHDAVKHVPNAFWRLLTQKLAEHPTLSQRRVYQIGETFGDYALISSYVNEGQLDAQFNFNLFDTALRAHLDPDQPMSSLLTELDKTAQVYGPLHVMGNVMDSHDKARFPALAEGDLPLDDAGNTEVGWDNPPQLDDPATYAKTQLYMAYNLTIPGIPVIYYGNEVALTGANDPDNRRPMVFGDDVSPDQQRHFEAVQALIALRNRHAAFRYGDLYPVYAGDDAICYSRTSLQERMLVCLNRGNYSQAIDVAWPRVFGNSQLTPVYQAQEQRVENASTVRISLAPRAASVWRIEAR